MDQVGDVLEVPVVTVPIQIIGGRRRSRIITIARTHPHVLIPRVFAGVILLMTTTVIVADSRTILQLVAFMTCVSK